MTLNLCFTKPRFCSLHAPGGEADAAEAEYFFVVVKPDE